MLSKEFEAALMGDFREHGAEVLERLREEQPDAYLEVLDELSFCKHPVIFAVLRAHLREL